MKTEPTTMTELRSWWFFTLRGRKVTLVTTFFKRHGTGAVMDLAVDITSAVHEVVEKKPDIFRWEAVRSGMKP